MARRKNILSSKRKSTARAKPPKVTGQRLDVGEEELQKTNQALQERVKELNCLYGLAQLVERPKITLEGIFQGLVELIPPGWQYPEITAARITFEKRRFKTGNFRKTAWLQSADIKVHGKKTGTIEVCYLKKRLPMDEGPFLRQERDLLDALAERLSRIAEREQAEEQLKATNQQLRQQNKLVTNVLESLAHPFYVIDANDYTVKLANRAAKFGPLTEESTCYALTHKVSKPCRGAEHPCPLNEIKRTKKPATTEHRHYDKDGNCRDIEVHAHPIFDSAGKISQIIEYCLDITERKKAEEETRQQHKNFLAIFDAAPVAMLLIDENTVVTKINDVAAKLVGDVARGAADHQNVVIRGEVDLTGRELLVVLVEGDPDAGLENGGDVLPPIEVDGEPGVDTLRARVHKPLSVVHQDGPLVGVRVLSRTHQVGVVRPGENRERPGFECGAGARRRLIQVQGRLDTAL